MNNYKLGSLFDGSGGFPLAGTLCGIEPVWASEVEPYPIAVTRSRFPSMKHLGDISRVNGAEIEPVDIITFGSPCQDLSVAGKRAGLKHEANGDEETTRSGLFMEAVRIIKEMRSATNGKYPRFALWENVPGAFSSNKGEDFRVVLEELVHIVEPSASVPSVPSGGWAYADSFVGDGWSLAYRVLDAQYWGVPQRRRRIYLVADFRGECARKVLFEREGLRGYFTQGRTEGQGTPADAEGSPGADDREGEGGNCITPWDVQSRRMYTPDGAWPSLYGGEGGGHGYVVTEPNGEAFDGYNGDLTGDKSATLGVNCGVSTGRNGVIERRAGGLDAVSPPAIAFEPGAARRLGGYTWEGVAGTLRAEMGDNQVAVAYVAAPDLVLDDQGGSSINVRTDGKSPTLRAETHGNQPCVLSVHPTQDPITGDESTPCLSAGNPNNGQACIGVVQEKPIAFDPPHYIVRRLTPTECARLQGFPDCHGHIEQKDALTEDAYRFWMEVRNTHARINGKKEQEYTAKQMLTWYNKLWTDSAEYKMWGNGIALPTALYVVQGIADALEAEEEVEAWML